MIDRIYLKDPELKEFYKLEWKKFLHQHSIKLQTEYKSKIEKKISFFIQFSIPIVFYRDSSYKWASLTKRETFLNANSPKIIVLKDGTHFLSTKNIGAWIIKDSTTIEWVLEAKELTPLFKYDLKGKRTFNDSFRMETYHLGLLFSKKEVPEFSRSRPPFKPIICFTDHCDFDTNESLRKQLSFFKNYNITVSKGFFLNHYSKRKDNSSYEREPDLIKSFKNEGHEVFFHAFTQSLRENSEAIHEFTHSESPPELDIKTYVDHGYQIYNFTKKHETGLKEEEWSEIMSNKGVKNLWTYLDSGTAMKGVCNQLNQSHFTLSNLIKYNGIDLKKIIRTELFFRGNENSLLEYRRLAEKAKELKNRKSFASVFSLLNSIKKVSSHLIHSFIFRRNETFKYAQFTPWIFQSRIGGKTYSFFQTIEVTNFEETFSKQNIDTLKKESGLLIAHCYFASPLAHQKGRLFDGNEISTKNHQNFEYIKEQVLSGNIWNPTISELIDYVNDLNNLEFSWDAEHQKIISNNPSVPLNYIQYV